MPFREVSNKVDFVALEHEVLALWRATDAFNTLRRLRAESEAQYGIFSFIDGPITANNPMGVHHAWGRTYKDLYQRYHAMLGQNQRWQNGFDCQGLWVEVNVEKRLGFNSKREIEVYGLDRFTLECKRQVLNFAAVQTEQSQRLGYWMDWNDAAELRRLRDLLADDPQQTITVQGPRGPVTGTVEQIVGRLGMPEMGGSYFTFSDENNYQIWAFLRKCFERGWMYKGTDVMPWCARCGTGISQHEIATEGYREVTHEAVFLRYPLTAKSAAADPVGEREALLVWTTTPWTLSSNVAAAVGPDLDYVQVQAADGWTYYLAEGALKNSLVGDYQVLARLKGSELIGWEYAGPFDDLPAVQEALTAEGYTHRVIGWKDVGAAEGTGIVHIAPGCGQEDFELAKTHRLPVIAPLDESGVFGDGFAWQSGRSVFDVAEGVFHALRTADAFYRKQRYAHRYPHCWRCSQELVYRLVDEWFISMGPLYDKPRGEVTAAEKAASFRYQIMDAVDQANWFPTFGYDREMDWLRNMHDWMISKKRYYGLALPIFECQECDNFHVVGSREELRERAVEGWEQFDGHTPHRPFIDAVKIACPHCGAPTERIKDVGNPWLDAGIVGISTLHYSSDPAYWRKWYPADWISESFPGQFRNWFYSLLAQSTLMADGVGPFRNLFGYSTLLAEDGSEMHKSAGNMIEFNEAADRMGADTMRWLYAGCKPDQNLRFGYHIGDETRRRFLIPLWNVYSFLVTYANLDGWDPSQAGAATSDNPANAQLDAWIAQRLTETALDMRRCLDQFDAQRATAAAEAFLEDLSNWYVRRSRRRFWRGALDADKQAAYAALYRVLVGFAQLLAPFIPFTAEAIYQNLVAEQDPAAPRSIHHTIWPDATADALDRALLDKMRLAITAASLGRAARGSADLKLRQPLARARINVGSAQARADLLELTDVLQEEINVKAIDIVAEVGELVDYKILPNNRLLGPKLGKQFPAVRQALAALDPAAVARTVQETGAVAVPMGGETVTLSAEELLVQTVAKGEFAVASERGVTVAVDTHLTAELVQEGYARDLVRYLNNARKEAGLAISDRIHVWYSAPEAVAEAVAEAIANFAALIQAETLALSLQPGVGGDFTFDAQLGDLSATLGLARA